MAIIPRFTSRALPPGAQPGLIKSAQRRGEAGAGLAKALGATIIAGVEFKKRKDLKAEAEAEAIRRALEDRPNGQDGVPRPPIRPPTGRPGRPPTAAPIWPTRPTWRSSKARLSTVTRTRPCWHPSKRR